MRVVVIEDEQLMAEDLVDTLTKLSDNIEVVQILSSVSDAISYFKTSEMPDLIFCDIQLGDGKSFEIFKKTQVIVPVIFCTAYDGYALEAFRNNGIDYILKPFTKKMIRKTIDKYKLLIDKRTNTTDYGSILAGLETTAQKEEKISYLLVNWKDRIIPIRITDIALFSIEYKMTQITTFDNQKYFVSHTLDELEIICGLSFYRANRQFLINREAIQEVMQHYARKLLVKLKTEGLTEVMISKGKAPEFLSWLRK